MSHIVMKLIPYNDDFKFSFLEDGNIKIKHPVSNYFLKLNDLSINLLISLKWILWAYKFFDELSKHLNELEEVELIEKAIQSPFPKNVNYPHLLMIDDEIIINKDKFINLLETFYNESIFDENTKVHVKLKLNLNEYLIISNNLFPTLIKFETTNGDNLYA